MPKQLAKKGGSMNTLSLNGIKITWLGHASFRIDAGKIIYIDPHVLDENPPKADALLMTHDHGDHCDIENAYGLLKDDTTVVATEICAGAFDNAIVPSEEFQKININDTEIEVIPAYNLKIQTHQRGEGFGYIIHAHGTRIYHAGDTDFIPEMEKLEVDVALLPIGGTFVMDVDDAVKAALAIKPEIAIPMHYNFLEGMERDPSEFKRKIEERDPQIAVEILE